MEPTRLIKLLRTGKYIRRLKGQVIYTFDDQSRLYMVVGGYVKRYLISQNGTIRIQAIFGPGSFFPLTPVFAHVLRQQIYEGTEVYCYEGLTDVRLHTLENETIAEATQKDPLLYRDILIEAGRRLESNIQYIENMSLGDALKQVAHHLVFLARRFGENEPRGIRINIPLTQQDLGDNLNMTRETISRVMGKLSQRGLIVQDKRIIIPAIDKLREIYA